MIIISGFAKDCGMSEVVLGTCVSGSVLLATLGKFLVSLLRGQLGQRKTGLLAFLIIFVSTTLPVTPLLLPGNEGNVFNDNTPDDNVTSGHVNSTAGWLGGHGAIPSIPLWMLVAEIVLGSFGKYKNC